MHLIPRLCALAAAAVLVAACGGDDGQTAASAGGEVTINMKDLKYEPASLEVKAGDTVTFVFTNDDTIRHDAFIGDEAAQEAHEKEMASAAASSDDEGHGDGHDMDSADAIVVEPGKTGELTHTFDETGTILIGCHEPGHYAAGMKVTINVD